MSLSLPNPFVGPRPLRRDEPLYGRKREVRELYNLLVSQSIVLLHSPSGAGKSSLIHAKNGLIDRLKDSFDVWTPTRVNQRPEHDCYNAYVWSAITGWEESLPDDLRRSPESLLYMTLGEYLDQRPRDPDRPKSRVLIFDQFEEVIRVDPAADQQKREFFRQAGEVLGRPEVWALFIIREDYLGTLEPYARLLPTHLQYRYRIDLPGPDQAIEIIIQTAASGGREVSNQAAAQLASDISGDSGSIEPLQLQVVGYDLWQNLNQAGIGDIEQPHIGQFAHIDTALANYYTAAVINAAGVGNLRMERLLRDWVSNKLINAAGVRTLVLRGPEEGDSDGVPTKVADELGNRHVIRIESRGRSQWYELAHDRLVRPALDSNKEWLENNLLWIERRADAWLRNGRKHTDLILDPDQLSKATEWRDQNPNASQTEKDYIAESDRAQESQRYQTRLFRLSIAAALAATVGLIAALMFAADARNSLEKAKKAENAREQALSEATCAREAAEDALKGMKAAEAEKDTSLAHAVQMQKKAEEATEQERKSRGLAVKMQKQAEEQSRLADARARIASAQRAMAEAMAQRDSNYDLAILRAIAAYRVAESTATNDDAGRKFRREMRNALLRFLAAPDLPIAHIHGHTFPVTAVSLNESAQFGASGDEDGNVIFWNAQTGKVLHTFAVPGPVKGISFTQTGTLAVTGGSAEVRHWDLQTGRPIEPQGTFKPCTPRPPQIDAATGLDTVNFYFTHTPDCRKVSLVGTNAVLVGPATGPLQRIPIPGRTDPESTSGAPPPSALHSSGAWVAWAEATGISVVNVPSGEVRKLKGESGEVYSLAIAGFTPTIAAGGVDGTVTVWQFNTPAVLATHLGPLSTALLSEDGNQAAGIDAAMRFVLWDLTSTAPQKRTFPQCGAARGLFFSASSKRFLMQTDAGLLDPLSGCKPDTQPVADTRSSWSLRFSDTGPFIIATDPGTQKEYPLRLPFPYRRPPPQRILVSGDKRHLVAADPRGKELLIGDLQTGRLRILDAAEGIVPWATNGAVLVGTFAKPAKGRDSYGFWKLPDLTPVGASYPAVPSRKSATWLPSLGFFVLKGRPDTPVVDAESLEPVLAIPFNNETDRPILSAGSNLLQASRQPAAKGLSEFEVWTLDPETAIRRACAVAGNTLSGKQWRAEFNNAPHIPLCPDQPERSTVSPELVLSWRLMPAMSISPSRLISPAVSIDALNRRLQLRPPQFTPEPVWYATCASATNGMVLVRAARKICRLGHETYPNSLRVRYAFLVNQALLDGEAGVILPSLQDLLIATRKRKEAAPPEAKAHLLDFEQRLQSWIRYFQSGKSTPFPDLAPLPQPLLDALSEKNP